MRWFLLLAIAAVIELVGLWQASVLVGFWPVFGIVVITGVLGASLAKREGLRVWHQWNDAMARGEMPAEGLVDGLLVLLGGALLVAPGLLADIAGLSLFLPPFRRLVATFVRAQLALRMSSMTSQMSMSDDGEGPIDPGAIFNGLGGFRVIRGEEFFSSSGFSRDEEPAFRNDRDIVVVETTGESVDEKPAMLALPAGPSAPASTPDRHEH
jgi:UPF0716 protein FxsA